MREAGYTYQTIAPYVEPVTLAQAKRQLREDGTDEDTFITSLIPVARQYVETYCGQQLVTATFEQKLDHFPCGNRICLNWPPLIGTPVITYIDTAGDTQTLSTSVYEVNTRSLPGYIKLAYNQYWPITRCQQDAVTITFTAGFATPFTVNTSTDIITLKGRTPTTGERVRLTGSEGTLPGGLSLATDYYVIGASGSTCQLSTTSGGAAVDITSAGSGTFFIGAIPECATQAMLMLIDYQFKKRSAQIDNNELPPQVGWALSPLMWGAMV